MGELADYRPSAVYVLARNGLRLDVEDLEPHVEVRLDPQEGFAKDDEGRNMHKGVRGEIVKIQPVEEHQPPDKGVEREAESSNEVGDENHPLALPRRGDDLALFWSAVSNIGGKVTHVLQLLDGALYDDGGLPLALGPRAGHDQSRGVAGGSS